MPQVILPLLQPIFEQLRHRQTRDHQRIGNYYGTMITEARHPRRKVDPETIASKVKHLELERIHRLLELEKRYQARIQVKLAGVLYVKTPVVAVSIKVRRRKGERELLLRLPARSRQFDRFPCDACHQWIQTPLLCDDQLHLLCEQCVPEATGRPDCGACRKKDAKAPHQE